jgi:hypothetical protein
MLVDSLVRIYNELMELQLSDEQAELLARELRELIDSDRFFLSQRVRTLQTILNLIRPQPLRPTLPPVKSYEPPRRGKYARRR